MNHKALRREFRLLIGRLIPSGRRRDTGEHRLPFARLTEVLPLVPAGVFS